MGLSAFDDDSIFVIKSAINFVVQYLLWCGKYYFQEQQNHNQDSMNWQYYTSIIDKIRQSLAQSTSLLPNIDSQLSHIAVIVDYLALADEPCLHLFLNKFPSLGCCIHHILHTGDLIACNQVTSIFRNLCSKPVR